MCLFRRKKEIRKIENLEQLSINNTHDSIEYLDYIVELN